MKRRSSMAGTTLAVLCVLMLIAPTVSVEARGRRDTDEYGPQLNRFCDLQGGPFMRVSRSAIESPWQTESLPRCAEDNEDLSGGVLATFDVEGERFKVWVTNPATIEQLLALEAGTSTASIPNGAIRYGAGAGNHNAPWSWHLDPEQIELADMTIELCDARPSYVEENTEYFVEVIGRYCPWGAVLVSIEDFR